MNKVYEVPVWFRITAETQDEAWWKIRKIISDAESQEQLPDYVVEEPVELLTGENGWNIEYLTPATEA